MAARHYFGSRGSEVYADRREAGRQLAEALETYRDQHPLILGIPRGGVPVAAEVARSLNAEMDVIVARKIGAPDQPELAIGAVTANGGLFLDQGMIADLGVRDAYLDNAIDDESAVAHRREQQFRGDRPPPVVTNRTVIIVDDGLATGATMRAAVRSVRKRHPARLVVAVPVGSVEACQSLRNEADEVVCPVTPELFFAVGLYYRNFLPTEDAEVEEILAELRHRDTPESNTTPAGYGQRDGNPG